MENKQENEIAELLLESANVTTFIHHATAGRMEAKRGHQYFLKSGQHYLVCHEMLKQGEKGPWFEREAKAVGCTSRTLYNYINLAREEIEREKEREKDLENLKSFQNLPAEEQAFLIKKAMIEAIAINEQMKLDKEEEERKKAKAEAKEKEEAARPRAKLSLLDSLEGSQSAPYTEEPQTAPAPSAPTEAGRKEPVRLYGGGPYNLILKFPSLPEVMRAALDAFHKSQHWVPVVLWEVKLKFATLLVKYGYAKSEKDLLFPDAGETEYQATDEDVDLEPEAEDEDDEDHSAGA